MSESKLSKRLGRERPLIFKPEVVELIQQGKKSQTRRPVKQAGEECRYQPGRMYAVQPGRGQPAKLHITITEVRTEKLGEITPKDAKREGFRNPIEFMTYWRALYGAADSSQEVWVLSFCVGDMTDQPRLLKARPGGPEGDYTMVPVRAAHGEPEAVSEAENERYARDAETRFKDERHESWLEQRQRLLRAIRNIRATKPRRSVDHELELAERRINNA